LSAYSKLTVDIGPTRKSEPKLLLSGRLAGLMMDHMKNLAEGLQGHQTHYWQACTSRRHSDYL